jgi:hypothetical protein
MKVAIEQVFDGSIPQVAIGGAYDSTKINRGKHTGQYNIGPNDVDKFIGPSPVGIINSGEISVSAAACLSSFFDPIKINDDLFWIFGNDSSTAAATRKVYLYTFVPSTNTITFRGVIIMTFPLAGNTTTTGLKAVLTNYTTGTVGVSGTAVTGSGTVWNTGLSVGSRIGFGSTNPDDITTWYQISAIGSDTSITLTSSGGTISAGTSYVIQDLMILTVGRNSSTPNNGSTVYLVKGLRFETFTNPATTIPAATTVDKIRAVYGFGNQFPTNALGPCGIGVGDFVSWTEQNAFGNMQDTTTNSSRFQYVNFRQALTSLSGGVLANTISMTAGQVMTNIGFPNNNKIGSLPSVYSGETCMFWYNQTNVYATKLSDILTNNNTVFYSLNITESVPGGLNTNATGGAINGVDILPSIDKVLVSTVNGNIYITGLVGGAFDRRISLSSLQQINPQRNLSLPIFPHLISSFASSFSSNDGWLFWNYTTGTTTTLSGFSVYPIVADLEYVSSVNNRIICPKINLVTTPMKFYRVLANHVKNIGDDLYGVTPDMYEIQYRTTGIDDDSGAWTDVPQNGDLSTVTPTSAIQFGFLFRTGGVASLPARILSLSFLYENQEGLPSQFRWNESDFNLYNSTFAWVQVQNFGTYIVSGLKIDIYRADTDALVLTQSSTGTTNGNFQYWNGTTWVNGLDGDVIGLRRRFVPTASLPSGINLYAKITIL